jgi:hypothetical protein
MDQNELTVGELKERLNLYPDSTKILISGGLAFYRFKNWGDDAVVLEFNEPQGYLSEVFKRRNPNVKVVFIDTAAADMQENGIVGSIDVNVR